MKGADRMARKLKWSLLSITLLLFVVLGYYTYAFVNFSNNIQSKPEGSKFFTNLSTQNLSKNGDAFIPPKWEGKQRVNVLLLGGDSRGLKKNEVPRSDSLIVASIDPVTKKAYLFSILRDTYVKIPGSGEDRINAALALGGPNLAMKTVGDLLGIPIQYYVYTDFKGFIALVDAIDGIDINVEKNMKYSDAEDGHEYDINLKKGMQHLDGKMALQYVRFRHDALSDFARTERQRNFMQAVAQKMQSTSSLIKLPKILSSIDPYIETNLTTSDMLKLGSLGYEAKTEGMVSEQIPPAELLIEKRVGSAEVISVNRDKLQVYIQALFDGRDPGAAAAGVKESPSPKSISSSSGGTSTNNRATTSLSPGIKSGTTSPVIIEARTRESGSLPSTGSKTGTAAGAKPAGTSSNAPAPVLKPNGASAPPATTSGAKPGSGGASVTPPADGKPVSTGGAAGSDGKPTGTNKAPVAGTKQQGEVNQLPAAETNKQGGMLTPVTGQKPGQTSQPASGSETKPGTAAPAASSTNGGQKNNGTSSSTSP